MILVIITLYTVHTLIQTRIWLSLPTNHTICMVATRDKPFEHWLTTILIIRFGTKQQRQRPAGNHLTGWYCLWRRWYRSYSIEWICCMRLVCVLIFISSFASSIHSSLACCIGALMKGLRWRETTNHFSIERYSTGGSIERKHDDRSSPLEERKVLKELWGINLSCGNCCQSIFNNYARMCDWCEFCRVAAIGWTEATAQIDWAPK